MEFLRKLFGASPKPATPAALPPIDARSFGGRRRHLEIVGEYYNQASFTSILGYQKPREKVNLTKVAVLVPNPRNEYDANAVEVRIDGHLVGHLSRDQAVGYHDALKALGHEGRALGNVEARIFGRPLDENDNGGFGVALYLPDSLAKQIGFGQRT